MYKGRVGEGRTIAILHLFCNFMTTPIGFTICDPLRENVHFRAKCIVGIRVKIAETLSLVAKTKKNYSLAFPLPFRAGAMFVRRSCRSQRPHKYARSSPEFVHGARETINVRSAFTNNYGLPRKLPRQTTWLHQLILRPETVGSATRASALARRSGGPS